MTRARQILLFLGACTLIACGGDDDDDGIIIADSGPTADSAPDSSVGCGDFEEAADGTNDTLVGGTGEATGISFAAGDTKVVCGVIDPAFMDAEVGVVDIDGFDIDVGDGAPLRAVLRTDGGDELGGIILFLQIVGEDGAATLNGGGFVNDYALATSAVTGAGTYRVAVAALPGEELPTGPIEYQIEIADQIPCAAAAGDPDYTEDNDGARSRRNDVVSATWADDPVTKLTNAPADAPEPTELTLEAGTPVHLRGTSADVAANDDYHDKDAYLVTLAAGVNEVDVRLTWPDGDIDMDAMAFVAEMVDNDIAGAAGAFIGTMADEVFTARVPDGVDLWVWAASYDDAATDLPVDYDVTI
ncbi:MAG TPA: hypothetical protein VIG06_23950, partial [Kofleriaceae bacterium]